jgi:hypothetical protein
MGVRKSLFLWLSSNAPLKQCKKFMDGSIQSRETFDSTTIMTAAAMGTEVKSAIIWDPIDLVRERQLRVGSIVQVDQQMSTTYLQYECRYKMCKYRNGDVKTWGELLADDYDHFAFLMITEVGLDSNTFLALSPYLTGTDRAAAMTTVRSRDTPEGKAQRDLDFLNLTCSHKGRMGGLTWGTVREKDYSYFVWAVGNTMNRETKSFNVFYQCLNMQGQRLVDSATKGQVKVPRGMKFKQ